MTHNHFNDDGFLSDPNEPEEKEPMIVENHDSIIVKNDRKAEISGTEIARGDTSDTAGPETSSKTVCIPMLFIYC